MTDFDLHVAEHIFRFADIRDCIILHQKFKFSHDLWKAKIETTFGKFTTAYINGSHYHSIICLYTDVLCNLQNILYASLYAGANVNYLSIYDSQLNMAYPFYNFIVCQIHILKLAIIHGLNPNMYSDKFPPIIIRIIEYGDINCLKLLLDSGADPNFNKPFSSGSALIHAAHLSEFNMIKTLIEYGADVNYVNHMGVSALFECISRDDFNSAKILIENGAELTTYYKSDSLLHLAAHKNSYKIAQFLINNKYIDINSTNYINSTPLHYAAKFADKDFIQMLIDSGAYIDAIDSKTFTPLHKAILNNRIDIAHVFVKNGANVSNIPNCDHHARLINQYLNMFQSIYSRKK